MKEGIDLCLGFHFIVACTLRWFRFHESTIENVCVKQYGEMKKTMINGGGRGKNVFKNKRGGKCSDHNTINHSVGPSGDSGSDTDEEEFISMWSARSSLGLLHSRLWESVGMMKLTLYKAFMTDLGSFSLYFSFNPSS